MDGRQSPQTAVRTYRAKPMACVASVLVGLLALVFAAASLRSGAYGMTGGALVLGAIPMLATLWLRLELTPRQLRYRTVLDTRTLSLDRINAAWIQAPRGAWSYWRALPMLVLSVDGARPLVLGLRTLPDAAVVALGEALQRRGIGIGVADSPAARRTAARIWPPPRR
jgi:hypothetical protein